MFQVVRGVHFCLGTIFVFLKIEKCLKIAQPDKLEILPDPDLKSQRYDMKDFEFHMLAVLLQIFYQAPFIANL